jgi:hypothetical protein
LEYLICSRPLTTNHNLAHNLVSTHNHSTDLPFLRRHGFLEEIILTFNMNSQQVNQVAPAVSSNQTVPAAQALSPDNPVHQNTQGGVRQLRFRNIQEAKTWINRVKVLPHVDPATDPTINAVDANRKVWVQTIMDAVYDLQHCQDNAQMMGHFTPSHKSCFQDDEVEAACHVLVDALLEHCRLGFRGLDKFNVLNNTSKRDPADETTNCHTRANNIVTALRTWKSIGKGMIEEEDKKWQLVNAPLSTIKKKSTEATANTRKKAGTEAGKTARQEVAAIEQSGRASIISQSLGVTSAGLSHGIASNGFVAQLLQQAPPLQGITVPSVLQGLASGPRVIARSTAGPTTGQSHASSTMHRGSGYGPYHNTVPAIAPIGGPSRIGNQNESSTRRGLDAVTGNHTPVEVKPRDELPPEDFTANPFDGLSEMAYDPKFDADALFPGGLTAFGASYSSFAPAGDAFNTFDANPPLGAYPVGIPPPMYPPLPKLPPPAFEQRSPYQPAPSHGAPGSTHVPYRAQAPSMAPKTPVPSLPSATAMNQNHVENVQHNPNISDFGNTSNRSSQNHYNATHQTIDQRTYYLGRSGLATPATPIPVVSRANSSMKNVQPRNDTHVDRSQDVSVAPNTQAAQTSTQLPQPVIHGGYAHIGSKRAREEQINEAPLPPSRRSKRDNTGAYFSDNTISSTDGEDEAGNGYSDSENDGDSGSMAGAEKAGNGNRGAFLDKDLF